MAHEALSFIEEYIRSYGNGSLVPIAMKGSDSPSLSIHSRIVDPFLLHFGSLRLVLSLEEGSSLSAKLLTRSLTSFKDPLFFNDFRSIQNSEEFDSFLDILSSKNLSSCFGLLSKPEKRKKELIVERLGELLVYRSWDCSFVVEGGNELCPQCKRLRPINTLKDKVSKGKTLEEIVKTEIGVESIIDTEVPQFKDPLEPLPNERILRKRKEKSNASPFNCPSCHKTFKEASEFKDHIAHHSELFVCNEVATCCKVFKDKVYFDIHVRRHSGIKKSYECESCHKNFLSNADLRIHSYTHSGERPFACSICGKKFVKKSQLQVHTRVHTGEKPHLCSECGISFGSMSTLIDHRKRTHMFHRPHECPTCHKEFFSRQELSNHTVIHSGERPFTCELCDKAFTRSHHLKRHMATLHKREVLTDSVSRVEEEREEDVMVMDKGSSELVRHNYTMGTKDDEKSIQILPESATTSLLELSQIVADSTVEDYEDAKYVIIEGDDGSAKLIQYSELNQ